MNQVMGGSENATMTGGTQEGWEDLKRWRETERTQERDMSSAPETHPGHNFVNFKTNNET